MKKQFISVMLGTAMCISGLIMPVAAAEDVSGSYTFENYNPSTAYDLPEKWSEKNGNSNRPIQDKPFWYGANKPFMGTQLYAKKGIYGKSSDDTAYDVNTLYRLASDGAFTSTEYDTRYDMAANLEGRRYIKAGCEMAVDSFRSTRFISFLFYNRNAANDLQWTVTSRLVEMVPGDAEGDYSLKLGGEPSSYAIPNNKWMKFDFVLDTQTKKADIYINGDLAKTDVNLGTKDAFDFGGSRLNSMIFGQYAVTLDGTNGTYEAHTYLDNVSYLLTDTAPAVDSYTAPDVIDFQDYEGTSLPQGFTADQNPTNQTYYKYEGLRGKNAQDISWRISAPAITKNTNDRYQNYRWKPDLDVSTYNTGFVKFSTEFCMEGASMTRGIALHTTHNTGWSDNDIIKIEKVNGEQSVTVGGGTTMSDNVKTTTPGTKITLDLPMSVVMKIDAVIDRREKDNNKFDLYINGEKVAENVKMPASYIAKVTEVILYAQQNIWAVNDVWNGVYGSRNCFPESDTYFDNMEIGRYYSYPAVKSYTSPSVTVMSKYNTAVAPIEPQTFGHWVPLRGYDSKYYYYAENVSMPADHATRAYKAIFGKLSDDTAIITNGNLVEVKNGAVKVYGRKIAAAVPTNKKFKLSFLFDIVNKTYNVYADDEAIAADVKFDTNNSGNPITEFSGIENTVTAEGQEAEVSAEPIASGAFTKLPEYAKLYELTNSGTSVTARILSSKLSGRMILAVYSSDNTCKSVVLGEDGETNITISKDASDTAKLMLWDNMTPVMNAVKVK